MKWLTQLGGIVSRTGLAYLDHESDQDRLRADLEIRRIAEQNNARNFQMFALGGLGLVGLAIYLKLS